MPAPGRAPPCAALNPEHTPCVTRVVAKVVLMHFCTFDPVHC